MSAHSARAMNRNTGTTRGRGRLFRRGHIEVVVIDHPENGVTYGLRAAVPLVNGQRPPLLFSGHLEKGMGTQARRLGHHFDKLEAKL